MTDGYRSGHEATGYPQLYQRLAPWWPLLSAPEDYLEEAEWYWREIAAASDGPVATILELGSGGGNNASHLKRHCHLTLVDRSSAMLAVSRALNPDCQHIEGDMRSVRLDQTFDAVFIHDAVDYMTTLEELRQAIETAYAHTAPGGVALFAPDHTLENFRPSTEHGGSDGADRGLRYLSWTWDPDPSDTTYLMDMVYLLRIGPEQVTTEYDRHVCGLFSEADWLRLLGEAGFTGEVVPLEHSEVEFGSMTGFLGTRAG